MSKISKTDIAAASILLIELIVKYGPDIAVGVMKMLEPGNITPAKIRALKVKDPETYFEGG